EDLFRRIDNCGAGTKLVLMDACRNEVAADSATRRLDAPALKLTAGVGVMFSCKGGEQAWEAAKLGKGHGGFFYHGLEGLRGKAKNDSGEVRWSRLAEYVTESVSGSVPKLIGGGATQTPHGAQNFEGPAPVLIPAGGAGPGKPAPPDDGKLIDE